MLTINADSHPLMRRFHEPDDEKRSVVVVSPAAWQDWLHADEREARSLLQPSMPRSSPPPRPARKSAKDELAQDDPAA